jgi:hypothetical protein
MSLIKETNINFTAIIYKIQTLIDGGWRVTFDVSDSDLKNLLALSELRQELLNVNVVKQ